VGYGVAVAGWQWLGWTGRVIAVILSGGKLKIGAVLAVAGWQWLGWTGNVTGSILSGGKLIIGAVLAVAGWQWLGWTGNELGIILRWEVENRMSMDGDSGFVFFFVPGRWCDCGDLGRVGKAIGP
jgi:hypothetical protein